MRIVGKFAAYKVRIVNKNVGLLAEHVFKFADYFEKENRVDGRVDYKNDSPHINANTRQDSVADWYIMVPSPDEIKQMARRILEYIDLYM